MIYFGLLLLLILVLAASWVMTLFSLPGNWLMVAVAAAFAYFEPASGPSISWKVVLVLAAMALFGEAAELVAAALGAKRAGGSRRGALLAICGSMAGAIVGGIVGLPIPVVGSMVAAIVGAGLGALAGAMFGEAWKGRSLDESWQVGRAAFWGRIVGTLAKTTIGSAMLVVAVVAAVF